jgi:signal transduction histidine kinase
MFIEPYIEQDYPVTDPFSGVNIIEDELMNRQFFVVKENHEKYMGILTISDVLTRKKKLVVDCLSPKPSILPDTTIDQAMKLMSSKQLPALPVIDENQHFYGILSQQKLVESLKHYQDEQTRNLENRVSLSERIKEEFFRNISHEIRTPLNAIQGLSEILLYSEVSDEEKENFAGLLHSKTDELLGLIDSVLNFSRIQAGEFRFSPNAEVYPHDLFKVLKEKAMTLQESCRKKHIEIKSSIQLPDNFTLKTNLNYLQEVMTNLISNAIKFTDDGIVEFGCFINKEGKTVFFVKDTGIGISPENKASIFKAFEKVDHKGTEIYPGLGLGLTLAAKIIEGSGGRIWFESEHGKGTCFYFYLGKNK